MISNQNAFYGLVYFLSLAFILYGALCIVTAHMQAEFDRYRLSKFRKLVGILELLGGLGLLVGLKINIILLIASGGLSLLMLLGVIVRFKVRDPFFQVIPAFSFFLGNLYIFISSV